MRLCYYCGVMLVVSAAITRGSYLPGVICGIVLMTTAYELMRASNRRAARAVLEKGTK